MPTYDENFISTFDPRTKGHRNQKYSIYYSEDTEDRLDEIKKLLKRKGYPAGLLTPGTILEYLLHCPQSETIIEDTVAAIIQYHS